MLIPPPAPPNINVGDTGWDRPQTRIGRLFCNGIALPLVPVARNIEMGGTGGALLQRTEATGFPTQPTGALDVMHSFVHVP